MSEQGLGGEIHLDEILANAIDLTENKVSYVNVIRFHLGINDIILDMYLLGPDPKISGNSAQAQRVLRIALAPGVAKEMAQLLLNGMSQWEDAFGITLPLAQHSIVDDQSKSDESKLND